MRIRTVIESGLWKTLRYRTWKLLDAWNRTKHRLPSLIRLYGMNCYRFSREAKEQYGIYGSVRYFDWIRIREEVLVPNWNSWTAGTVRTWYSKHLTDILFGSTTENFYADPAIVVGTKLKTFIFGTGCKTWRHNCGRSIGSGHNFCMNWYYFTQIRAWDREREWNIEIDWWTGTGMYFTKFKFTCVDLSIWQSRNNFFVIHKQT